MRRLLVVLVGLVLLASACSGSSDAAAGSQGTNVSTVSSDRAALQLIAELGSDAAATDALIIAMERGYSGPQILAAADANTLRADGTIEGQAPEGSPLGLVLYDGEGADQGASGGSGDPVDESDERVLAFRQPERTPIERMRDNATNGPAVGDSGAIGILAWLTAGFTPQDVIEILIFGIDGVDDNPLDPEGPTLCLRVVDELYCPGGERYPANQPETAADAPATASDAPADTEQPAAEDTQWTGPLSGTYTHAGQGESTIFGELENVDVVFDVTDGVFDVSVTRTAWGYQRGGPDPEGRNCSARVVESFAASGPLMEPRTAPSGRAGRLVRVDLEVVTSQAIDREGTLCELVNWERVEREPGRGGGFVSGIVGPWGFEGHYGQIPVNVDIAG